MSTITIGFAPPDLTGAVSSRAAVTADPDAFAAQLQSITEIGTSIAAPEPTPPVDATAALPTDDTPTAATDEPLALAVPPASFELPSATPAPIVAAAPSPVPVVRPDAGTSQPAATSTSKGTAPLSSSGVSQDVATSVARPADPAAPIAPTPVAGRRVPRHALASDALPPPIAAISAGSLPITPPTATPVPVMSPASITQDQSIADEAVAISNPAPVGAGSVPSARPTSSRGSGEKAVAPGGSPAVAVAALPITPPTAPVAARSAVGNSAHQAARVVGATATPANSQAFAAALEQPTVRHASAEVVPPPEATAQPQPLSAQLAPPILALRSAGRGTHVLTLTVSPESVGPVTVRAHVTGGIMRIELSAPTDQGTDALQSMLSDLKRDLSQGGVTSALTIASPDSGGVAAGNQNAFGGAGGFFAGDDRPSYFRATPPTPVVTPVVTPVSSPSPNRVAATTALDVLA